MKIHPLAIIAGLFTDLGLSIFVAPIILMIFGVDLQNAETMLFWAIPFGFGATIIAGGVAYSISSTDKIYNVLLLGSITILVGIVVEFGFKLNHPLWFTVLSFTLTIPASFLGAVIARRL
jgi:hypothetical protein